MSLIGTIIALATVGMLFYLTCLGFGWVRRRMLHLPPPKPGALPETIAGLVATVRSKDSGSSNRDAIRLRREAEKLRVEAEKIREGASVLDPAVTAMAAMQKIRDEYGSPDPK